MIIHPRFPIAQALGLIPYHQPNLSEFSTLAAVVHSCFHPDGASVGLNSDTVHVDWTHLYTRHQWAATAIGVGAFGGSAPAFLEASGRNAPLLQAGTSLSQSGFEP